ncbi:SAM-dependent methyltransferase [Streptomyces hesseae]|uniref:Methyltransferase domain-containing protein n=1 Tax=Streptomyces hesseae TaxID=3075519 RepID=A0ABU2SF20_9ACTN|nr:methyltransferase domain-containing protein [Streptomyces sp. DSM 40473]MDT0447578.1 methyltransferase domain-containing protein [Streptomyces sp. DSM 40473]
MSYDDSTPNTPLTGDPVDAARRYYDTSDVDAFYARIWGGEDIHTGIYAHEEEPVAAASRRTIERAADKIAERLARLGPECRILDLGSGYGGPTRYLAERFGCRVVALNISENQNEHHRSVNAERGLDGLIEVVTGSFQDIPFRDGHFDVVWSQEAFCHSGDRQGLLREAVRVLAPRGDLVFTDLMAAEDTPPEALHRTIARLEVDALATPSFYRRQLTALGLARVDFDDRSEQLLTHYTRLTDETRSRATELGDVISAGYLAGLMENLPLWVDACRDDLLRWGIFHARHAHAE